MPSDAQQTIFLLGAAGYLGSQFLVLLNRRFPQYGVVALVRNLDVDKETQLKDIDPNLVLVEGSLDDSDVIKAYATQAKYVINCASSDHPGGVQAILDGLEAQSANSPGEAPLYLHVSGTGIISDGALGEFVQEEKIPRYSDIGLDLETLPPTNPHLNCDKLIVAAGSRKENPVRTIIAFPGWIYGIGEGVKKSTLAYRILLTLFHARGQAGTWGPGYNSLKNVHVKDCANGLLTIFEAALGGKADEGPEGLYFISSDEPRFSLRDISATIGEIMLIKGLVSESGCQFALTSAADVELGKLFGGNQRGDAERLKRLGWDATEAKQVSLLKSLPQEIEVALHELQL